MLMTPDYASPEQVPGERITVASDVYSLGVVLYEILTGHRPYDTRNQSPGEIERLVCTTGVTAPSANAPMPRLRKQLKGDLDNILLMALLKEPQRRYASVAQFGEDIRRHLDGRTVIARPDTARYRVSKFLARNRVMAVMALLVLAATAAGVFFTVREGLIAQRRFAEVRSLATCLLNDVDPELSKIPGTTRARKLLVDKSFAYLDGLASEASGDPDLQREPARAYHRAGDIQGSVRGFSLGLYNESLESHLKAVEILEPLYGKVTADLAIRRSLAALYAHIGDLHLRRGDSTRGHQFLKKASAFVDSSDPVTLVDVKISLLRTHLIEGHIDQSLAVAQAAIPVAAKFADPSRLINLYAFAAESAMLLGRVSQGIDFAKTGLAAGSRPVRREDAMRVANLQYQLGELMSWPLQPNAEMPCEAIPILDSAAKAAFAVLEQDKSQVNLRVQTMSMYSRLAAAQALCHKPEGIASAEQAVDIYRSSGLQPIASQLVPLAFSHFQLGHADSALQILQPLIADEPSASDLYAAIMLARGDAAKTRRRSSDAAKDHGEGLLRFLHNRLWTGNKHRPRIASTRHHTEPPRGRCQAARPLSGRRRRPLSQTPPPHFPPALTDAPSRRRRRPGIEKLLRCHHPVALKKDPVLHHVPHVSQRVDLLQRILPHGDQVCWHANRNRPALVVNIRHQIPVYGHDL